MNTRATVLTLGTTLALLTPAAQAYAAGNTRGCGAQSTHAATNARSSRNSLLSPRSSRALQYVTFGDGAAASQPARTTCAHKTLTAPLPPNRYQVARDAL